MVRILFLSCLLSCSSASFDVAPVRDSAVAEDTGVAADATNPDDTDVAESAAPDTAIPDAPCTAVAHDTTDVYVNAAAPVGGKGSEGCPFKTLAEAAKVPLESSVTRVVHVRGGTYNETSFLRVRARETYRGESGTAKVMGSDTTNCAPLAVTCTAILDATGAIANMILEGAVAHPLIMNGSPGMSPSARAVTVRNAPKAGILVVGAGATIGPNVRSENNTGDGVRMMGTGTLKIEGTGNAFDDNNKGEGAGIHVLSGTVFIDGGATANNNVFGILFDGPGNGLGQTVSQLTAEYNRKVGLVVMKTWKKVTVRKSRFTRNAVYGAYLEYELDSAIDLGTAEPGGNTFGGASTNNAKAGLFLCNTATHVFDSNQWGNCAPTSQPAVTCETPLTSYTDYAFVARAGVGTVITAPNCTRGP